MDLNIIIYIIFGILPSLTWLAYYLQKDLHPEPKKMIIKIFLWGIMIALPVFFVQIGISKILDLILAQTGSPHFNLNSDVLPYLNYALKSPLHNLNNTSFIIVLAYWFIAIALSEEFFKYVVIRTKVINSPHLDEPLDIMLYMVVAALGFAAIENILYLFNPAGPMSFSQLIGRTLAIDFIRFIGATFLHTLCSAIIGYSLAISFCDVKIKKVSVFIGIFFAVLLHGLYDFSIITLEGYAKLAIPIVIILSLAFFVFSGFESLKRMKSICKIK